ncbi:MAG: rhodanese-like domain-containing protein [Planctomycetota bacterium]
MKIKQYYLGCLAHASYLVVDERSGTAAVIDPQRDVDQYVEDATAQGATIEHVLLTHFHADFIAGHLELRDRVGARIFLGARARAEYEFTPLEDGDVVEFGDTRLSIMETPGHTPEGISILALDLTKSDSVPEAVFTGDTLFVGDVGRPDLLGSVGVTADDLASWLYDSLHDKILALPDETLVYPAHGAGSMCGKNLGKETFSTIGEQRRVNYALQPMTRDEFRAIVTADQPSAPPYFLHDAILNQKERATLETSLDKGLRPLTLTELLDQQRAGAIVVDVRDAADFAGAHLEGAVNIGLDGKYATWAGTVLTSDMSIVLIAEPGEEAEAAMRLGRIGYDDVRGYLDGGMAALSDHDELLSSVDRVTAVGLSENLADADPPLLLDVRNRGEWDSGHVAGSVNIPLGELRGRIEEVPRDRAVAVMCKSGYRSSIATSLLLRESFTELRDAVGGFDAWQASGLETSGDLAPACDA